MFTPALSRCFGGKGKYIPFSPSLEENLPRTGGSGRVCVWGGEVGGRGWGWGWGPASTFRRPLSFSQFLCRFLAFGKILTQSGPPSPLLPFIFLTENSMSSAHSVMTQTGFILHPHADTDWPVLTPMFTQAGLSSPPCLHRLACPHPHVYTDRPVLTPMFTQTGLSSPP